VELQDHSVVVTGGTGFLGRYVCEELARAGAKVTPIGRAQHDLRSRSEIDEMLQHLRPDAVVHLAAVVGGIGANHTHPGRFLYENALMGLELLEACRVAGVAKTLVAGTVCSYPKFTPVPFREDHLWDGYPEETNAPYGIAKKLLLAQAQAYRSEYGVNTIYLLPVNMYGPGDNFDLETAHVIPAMIRKFIEAVRNGASEVVLWGDGSPTREFLYVEDAARAFRFALELYDGREPVNIGSGAEISIRDLASLIAELTGYHGKVVWDDSRPNGQPRRSLDTARARRLLRFEAETDLRVGIDRTITWYAGQVDTPSRPEHPTISSG
jgi:GDP-L-fucose synthase